MQSAILAHDVFSTLKPKLSWLVKIASHAIYKLSGQMASAQLKAKSTCDFIHRTILVCSINLQFLPLECHHSILISTMMDVMFSLLCTEKVW